MNVYFSFNSSHVHRTGHIGDFAIISEEAIAKGIRRIVALTGPEASKALRKSHQLEVAVHELESRSDEFAQGGRGEAGNRGNILRNIVELNEDVSRAPIPYWNKHKLRTALGDLKRKLDEQERSAMTAMASDVATKAKELAEANKGAPFIVAELPAKSSGKALDGALKQVKIVSPDTAALFFSVDHEAGKIMCLSAVPKSAVKNGLKATEWVGSVTQLLGGRGGGKPESAQASGPNVKCLAEAVQTAISFAKSHLKASQPAAEKATSEKAEPAKGSTVSKGKKSASSLILHFPEGLKNAALFPRMAAGFSGNSVDINSKGVAELVLEKDGSVLLKGSSAIAYHLAGNSLGPVDAETLQWVFYADNHLIPYVLSSTMGNKGCGKQALHTSLKCLDSVLSERNYLNSSKMSLGDLAVFCSLIPLSKDGTAQNAPELGKYNNVKRWFTAIRSQKPVIEILEGK
ncbi:hypothetical protein J437_LFUL010797 [Ladona fulva]|uniref:GST C-terminal domain-containing protein n=1 Tax=Ladona fulva TaxID=123851 RepID=A0A8K0K817_LADFU|nr:hypothetical protein J437_LFUL010797 [Ladona fulva]